MSKNDWTYNPDTGKQDDSWPFWRTVQGVAVIELVSDETLSKEIVAGAILRYLAFTLRMTEGGKTHWAGNRLHPSNRFNVIFQEVIRILRSPSPEFSELDYPIPTEIVSVLSHRFGLVPNPKIFNLQTLLKYDIEKYRIEESRRRELLSRSVNSI